MDTKSVLRIDAGNTRVSFSVLWFGVIHVRGSFRVISGSVTVPGEGVEDANVTIEVDPTSVRTGISLRDHHLRGMRFLDSGQHPVIGFVSDHATRHNGTWDLQGRLLLRGHERPVSAEVTVGQEAGPSRQLTVDFAVPRRPHSIGTASGIRAMNPLLWAIGDEVRIHVEMLVPATILTPAGEHAPAR
jgi:polyisoprenoid-binding protein YceI